MGVLADTEIRNLKPRQSAYQVADGDGPVLEVRPSGQRAWLYRYRLKGRAEELSLDAYPALSLAAARKRHRGPSTCCTRHISGSPKTGGEAPAVGRPAATSLPKPTKARRRTS